jgi:hypothetical protein
MIGAVGWFGPSVNKKKMWVINRKRHETMTVFSCD